MADFSLDLNEDQLQIQKWVHDFAEDVMRPAAHEWDEREETPWPIIEEAAKVGLYSMEFGANAVAESEKGDVHGRIDHASAEAFRLALEALLADSAEGRDGVVLDFAGVEYISSVGLRVLMMAAKQVRSQKGRIVVAAMQPVVKGAAHAPGDPVSHSVRRDSEALKTGLPFSSRTVTMKSRLLPSGITSRAMSGRALTALSRAA